MSAHSSVINEFLCLSKQPKSAELGPVLQVLVRYLEKQISIELDKNIAITN